MTCSATSFGCSASSPPRRFVLFGVGAPAAGPGDGARRDDAVAQAHERLGRRPHHRAGVATQEVEVRAGIDQTQHPVEVEGIGPELEVEALRQHHLEDVPGVMWSLATATASHVHLGRHCPAHLGRCRRRHRAPPVAASPRAGTGRRPVRRGARRRRRTPRPTSASSQSASTTTLSTSTTRWRQWSKAHSWPITASRASGSPGRRGARSAGARPRAPRRSPGTPRARRAAVEGRPRAGDR